MMSAIDRALGIGSSAQPVPAGVETSVAEKLASQEQEIRRLKALLQQQEQPPAPGVQSGATDVTRWQTLVKERETALTNLKKQTIAQHQAMSQQIGHLQAQLAEKETLIASLQGQIGGDGQPGTSDLAAVVADKAQADKLIKNLTKIIAVQQKAIEKHREEAERLARELHVLAAGIQMLGQSLGDQASEMSSVVDREG
jgi:hypothetical protein